MEMVLGPSEDVQMVSTLVICAKNCMVDLLRSKRRAIYDAHALLSPLLKTTKLGLPVDSQRAVLQFAQSFLLVHSSEESLKCLVTPEDLAAIVATGVSLVGSSRMSMDNAAWRKRCESTIKITKLLSVNSPGSEVCVWNVSLFLSVVLSDDISMLPFD